MGALGLCGGCAAAAPLASLGVGLSWLVLFVALGEGDDRCRSPNGRRGRMLLSLLALSVAAVSWSRAREQLDDYKQRWQQMRAHFVEPLRCAGRGTVVSSPLVKTRQGATDSETILLYRVSFKDLDCEGTQLTGPVHASIAGPVLDLARDDEIHVYSQLSPVRLFRNAGLPDPWLGAARSSAVLSGSALDVTRLRKSRSLAALIDHFRAQVRSRIEATYSPITAPLGRALVLGESDLPGQDAEAFRHSGLLHLLAVSGTHLVIFVLSLVRILRAILIRIEALAQRYDPSAVSAACGAIMSLLYADFSGGSGSAFRAAYMLCAVCGARSLGVRISGPTALGASLLIGVGIDPLAPGDYSFLLSALATAGLIGIGQPLTRFLVRGITERQPLRFLIESLGATLASSVPCAPLLAMMSGEMTWAALLANVVAAPLGEVIALPACLLHALVSPWPAVEAGLALLGSGALYGVRAVALGSASLTVAQFKVPFPSSGAVAVLIGLYLVGTFLLSERGSARSVAWKVGILCCGAWILGWAHPPAARGASPKTLSITALDVGQGDALVLRFGDDRVALVDGGGFATGVPDTGSRVVLPYLRSRDIDHIDLMVLSHAHPDHISGLITVAAVLPVRTLWIPEGNRTRPLPQGGTVGRLIGLVQARGGSVEYSATLCDRSHPFGSAQLEVLAPCAPAEPPLGLNDDSLVLRASYGKHAALLTGDVEERGEQRLLAEKRALLRADLLKVPHHGSDTSSTPAFIAAVGARHAFISSGVRNRFRHPRPETLATLGRARVQVLRTDQRGSLSWLTDGHQIELRSFDPLPQPTPPLSLDLLVSPP